MGANTKTLVLQKKSKVRYWQVMAEYMYTKVFVFECVEAIAKSQDRPLPLLSISFLQPLKVFWG